MKKILSILVIILVLTNGYVFADDTVDEFDEGQLDEIIEVVGEVSKEPTLNSRAAVVYDRSSKTVIYGKNENEKRAMASTTKIMTCIVVLEKGGLNQKVEVSKKAAGTGGSRLGLRAGDIITIKDLLYGLMLKSGNDAAVTLAESIGGSVENFANLMNEKAKELGLINTNFVTPHGLDNIQHYTTATELAMLTDYALQNPNFLKIVGTQVYTVTINGSVKEIRNTNELLGNLNGVYGVKTGFTNNAGRCLVTSTKRGDMDIICVVLGADTKKFRTRDSANLIEYTFSNYGLIDIKPKIEEEFEKWKNENSINVIKGKEQVAKIEIEKIEIGKYPINQEEIKDINIEIESIYELEAPIEQSKKIGKLKVKIKDREIYCTDLIIKEKIDKKDISYYFYDLFLNFYQYIQLAIINK